MSDSADREREAEGGTALRRWVGRGVALLVGWLLLGSVAGYLAGAWWLLGLFVHFRHVYLVAGLACVPVSWWVGGRWIWGALAAVIVLNGAYVAPWYLGNSPNLVHPPDEPAGAKRQWDGDGSRSAKGRCGTAESLRVAVANVRTSNRAYEKIKRFVAGAEADVVVLMEYAAHTERGVGSALTGYPHRLVRRRRDNFGIAVFSKVPFRSSEVVRPAGGPVPQLHVVLEGGEGPVHLWAVHPLPPVKASYVAQRNELLAKVGAFVGEVDDPVIVAGDLNTTMWSGAYGELVRHGLVNARRGRGVLGTWPVGLPVKIPIDHVLHTTDFQTCDVELERDIGSDHRGMVVGLGR